MSFDYFLDGWVEVRKGDVISCDGEYLGRWSADESDHPTFYPDGEPEREIRNPFLGQLVQEIREWHTSKGSIDV